MHGELTVEQGRAGKWVGGRSNSEPKAVGRSEESCIFRSEDYSLVSSLEREA